MCIRDSAWGARLVPGILRRISHVPGHLRHPSRGSCEPLDPAHCAVHHPWCRLHLAGRRPGQLTDRRHDTGPFREGARAHTRGCGPSLPAVKLVLLPVGQVALEGVLEVLPEVLPVDGATPAPREPRPMPRPARMPLTWSVIRSVRVLFIVSA